MRKVELFEGLGSTPTRVDHIAIPIRSGRILTVTELLRRLGFEEDVSRRRTRFGEDIHYTCYLTAGGVTVQLIERRAPQKEGAHIAIRAEEPRMVAGNVVKWIEQGGLDVGLERVGHDKWHVWIPGLGIRLEFVPFS